MSKPNITSRLKFPNSIMDLQEAHIYLGWEYWDKDKSIRFPSVWVYMARFVRALDNPQTDNWWDTEKAKEYIRSSLGRKQGNAQTFLTELFPLPKRRANEWPLFYQDKMQFQTRQEYEKEIIFKRKQVLKQMIQDHHPKYLLCYDGSNFDHYKDLVEVHRDNWMPLDDTKFEIASTNKTCIILSPFMGNGRVGFKSFTRLIEHLRKTG